MHNISQCIYLFFSYISTSYTNVRILRISYECTHNFFSRNIFSWFIQTTCTSCICGSLNVSNAILSSDFEKKLFTNATVLYVCEFVFMSIIYIFRNNRISTSSNTYLACVILYGDVSIYMILYYSKASNVFTVSAVAFSTIVIRIRYYCTRTLDFYDSPFLCFHTHHQASVPLPPCLRSEILCVYRRNIAFP